MNGSFGLCLMVMMSGGARGFDPYIMPANDSRLFTDLNAPNCPYIYVGNLYCSHFHGLAHGGWRNLSAARSPSY